jgi:hypothetical protein
VICYFSLAEGQAISDERVKSNIEVEERLHDLFKQLPEVNNISSCWKMFLRWMSKSQALEAHYSGSMKGDDWRTAFSLIWRISSAGFSPLG